MLSLEDWAFAMVAKPVLATLLLFPIKPCVRNAEKEERERIASDGQVGDHKGYVLRSDRCFKYCPGKSFSFFCLVAN